MASDKSKFIFSQALGYNDKFQINQALEKRAGLLFYYGATNRSMHPMKRWLPFYENPMIIESRKSNYAENKIFLRDEPVRLFTGAQARQFRVDIHYSLIHMASMVPTSEILSMFSENPFLDNEEISAIEAYVKDVILRDTGSELKILNSKGKEETGTAGALNRAILQQPQPPTMPNNPYTGKFPNQTVTIEQLDDIAKSQTGIAARYLNEIDDRPRDGTEGPFGPLPNNVQSQWNDALVYTMGTQSGYAKLASLFQYVCNHIRASVIGSGEVGVKGPPLVHLKFGAMYDFVPCIVKDYRLQPVEDAGYDTKSLFSQRLKVSLTLEEMRNVHGNSWSSASPIQALPGWENILQEGWSWNPLPATGDSLKDRTQTARKQFFSR